MPPDLHEFLRCASTGLALSLLLCIPTLVYRWLRGRPLIPGTAAPSRGSRLWTGFGAILFSALACLAFLQHKPTFGVAFGIAAFASVVAFSFSRS